LFWRLAAVPVLAGAVVAGWVAFRPGEWRPRTEFRVTAPMWLLAISRDGKTLATWSEGQKGSAGRISIWETSSGRHRLDWPVRKWAVHDGAFAPDGATFAFVEWGGPPEWGMVHRFDVATARPLPSADLEPISTKGLFFSRMEFTPDGAGLRIVFGGDKGVREVVTWDPETGRVSERRTVSGRVPTGILALSPDGRLAASAEFGDLSVTVWDLAEDREYAVLPPAIPPRSTPGPSVASLAFSPDGATLAVARDDGQAEFRDLQTARVLKTLTIPPPGYGGGTLLPSPGGTTLVALGSFHPGPPSLVSGLKLVWAFARDFSQGREPPREATVFDVPGGRRLALLKPADDALLAGDGRTLATLDKRAGTVRVWDMPPTRRAGAR